VNGSTADFGETQSRVKGVRRGVRRDQIDFADDSRVACIFGSVKKVGVERFGVAFAASQRRGDYAIDVNEAVVALAKSEEIGAVVAGVLIESKKQSRCVTRLGSVKTLLNQAVELI